MADVDLNVTELSVPELLATAAGVASALEKNENFPHPDPDPEELERLADAVSKAEGKYREERARANAAQVERDHLAEELRAALVREAAYVQEVSGGSIAKILSANLHVEEPTSLWPFGSLAQVDELTSSVGDQPGEIDLAWNPVAAASGYEVEVAYDLTGEGPWEQSGATTQSKITIEKLDNRTRYWFRVRAVGEKNVGDWSDPVMRYAR